MAKVAQSNGMVKKGSLRLGRRTKAERKRTDAIVAEMEAKWKENEQAQEREKPSERGIERLRKHFEDRKKDARENPVIEGNKINGYAVLDCFDVEQFIEEIYRRVNAICECTKSIHAGIETGLEPVREMLTEGLRDDLGRAVDFILKEEKLPYFGTRIEKLAEEHKDSDWGFDGLGWTRGKLNC